MILKIIKNWMIVFVISRIIKVKVQCRGYQPKAESDNSYEGLDYSGYHKKYNNCFIIHSTTKNGRHVFGSSLTESNRKRAKLTRLPLEIMYRSHT